MSTTLLILALIFGGGVIIYSGNMVRRDRLYRAKYREFLEQKARVRKKLDQGA